MDESQQRQLEESLDPLLMELSGTRPDEAFHTEAGLQEAIGRGLKIPNALSRDKPVYDEPSRLGTRIGQYEILQLIGSGGMGVVYLARHVHLATSVAIKLLSDRRVDNPNAIARFEREMRLQANIDHPNVVSAIDGGVDDGHHYVVMKHIDGVDVSEIVRGRGPIAPGAACEIVRQAAVGLQYLHENGLIHRDVKPANMIVGFDKVVRLIDFGLARVVANDEALTQTDQVVGTLTYLAPELLSGRDAVSERSDIYSLGATFHFLLTGQPPERFATSDSRQRGWQAVDAAIPPSLEPILARFLDPRLERRFKSAAEAADALAPVAETEAFSWLVEQLQHGHDDESLDARSQLSKTTLAKLKDSTAVDRTAVSPDAARSDAHEAVPPGRRRRIARLAVCAGVFSAIIVALAVYCFTGTGDVVLEGDTSNLTVLVDAQPVELSDNVGTAANLNLPAGSHRLEVMVGERRILDVQCRVYRGSVLRYSVEISEGEPQIGARVASAPESENEAGGTTENPKQKERRIAQFLLQRGGRLLLYPTKRVSSPEDLPDEPFGVLNVEASKARITDDDCRDLGALKGLKSLQLSGNPLTDESLRHLTALPRLQWLHFGYTKISNQGLEYLLPHGDTLATLDLHNTGVSDAGIRRLIGFDVLRELILYDTGITDQSLVGMDRFPALLRLDVARTQVSDVGLQHLTSCRTLKYLVLDSTRVSDQGIDALAELKELTTLSVKDTAISANGIDRLQRDFPECVITR